MRAAEGIAGAEHGIEAAVVETFQRDGIGERRRCAADGAGGAAGAQRGGRQRKLDEAATAERVAEAAFPRDERRAGKRARERPGLEAAGLERTGAVALEPGAAPSGRGGQRREARVKAGAVGLVGGEMVHFIVQRL